jgi:hypothetical protein
MVWIVAPPESGAVLRPIEGISLQQLEWALFVRLPQKIEGSFRTILIVVVFSIFLGTPTGIYLHQRF